MHYICCQHAAQALQESQEPASGAAKEVAALPASPAQLQQQALDGAEQHQKKDLVDEVVINGSEEGGEEEAEDEEGKRGTQGSESFVAPLCAQVPPAASMSVDQNDQNCDAETPQLQDGSTGCAFEVACRLLLPLCRLSMPTSLTPHATPVCRRARLLGLWLSSSARLPTPA
jgi:hypothetical protein